MHHNEARLKALNLSNLFFLSLYISLHYGISGRSRHQFVFFSFSRRNIISQLYTVSSLWPRSPLLLESCN